jgi:cytosine/adenosine deaminase-related metal-dependent hydrolase
MYAIINAKTYDFKTYKDNQYIIFNKKIIDIGDMTTYINNNYKEIDANNQLVMPGLVNGHSHVYSTFSRGLNVPFNPNDFKELLEQLWWKLDRNLTNETTYYSGIVSGVEYMLNGVTTIIDHHASGEILGSLDSLKKAICDDAKLRGIFCFETSDRFDIGKCITENSSFIKNNKDDKTQGLFGMHAAFTLCDKSLERISKNNKTPIHIHVAESIIDQELSMENHQMRVIERLDKYNLITPNSIITHGIYLSNNELEIIKKRNAVVALNVTSNMNNAVGLPDYFKMREKGINVIIGNDGITMNMTSEYKSLFYTMHHTSKSPNKFNFDNLLEVINSTYKYASDILGVKLGKIEKGFASDLLIVPYNKPTPLNNKNIFGHLFFGLFNDFKPSDVFVDGNHILNDFKASSKLMSKYNESEKYALKLWKKIEEEGQA